MNWRVRILTAVLVVLFALGCFLYIRFYVSPKAHGVVLFIAPAADLTLLANLENSVFHHTQPEVSLITDPFHHPDQHFSYLSTGTSTPGNLLGMNPSGEPLDNLFYQAQRSARRIGIVTTSNFTHPAAAAFYQHSALKSRPADIAPQLFDSTIINVLLGGNPQELTQDPYRNLLQEAEQRGYHIIQSPEQIADIPRWRTRLLLGAFDYPDDLFDPESHATSPSLEEMVILAIQCLQFHIGGYFMVVVHPDPDDIHYAGELPEEFRRAQAFQLNTALKAAYDYTGENGSVMLYAPQTDSHGWFIQLKGNDRAEGVFNLKQLHHYIQKAF